LVSRSWRSDLQLFKIEKNLEAKGDTDTFKLQELLIEHRNIEENDLYPKLDDTLNERQKELTLQRINEISNLGAL